MVVLSCNNLAKDYYWNQMVCIVSSPLLLSTIKSEVSIGHVYMYYMHRDFYCSILIAVVVRVDVQLLQPPLVDLFDGAVVFPDGPSTSHARARACIGGWSSSHFHEAATRCARRY